jgi:hypothetical protein
LTGLFSFLNIFRRFEMAFFKEIGKFLGGSPEKHKRVSTLTKQQQPLADQLVQAGLQPGAGGSFGDAADYYRNNLSDNPADLQAFAAPELRRFNEEIIPGISEQFAGMGAGGLSSSGFQNASVNAGTDLAERLGAIRAGLRQQSAQGLTNIGQLGLQPMSQDVVSRQGTQGMLAPAIGAIGTAIGGPALGQLGTMGGNWLNSFGANKVGRNTSPYAGGNAAQSGGMGMGR